MLGDSRMSEYLADNWDIRTVGSLLIIKKPERLNPVTSSEAETKSYFIRKSAITSISTQIIRIAQGTLSKKVQNGPYGSMVEHILPPAESDRYMYKISLSHPPSIIMTELGFKSKANFERVLLLLGGIINDNPDGLNNKLFSVFPITNPVVSKVASASVAGGGAGTGGAGSLYGGRRTRRLRR